MAGIIVKPRSRIFHGHDWVYTSEVLKSFGDPADGDIVSIKDGADRLLGSGIYNSHSQIIARRFSRQRQDLDADFFRRRIKMAIEYRARRGIDPRLCRIVWSESDGVPGLVVDCYGDCLVVQTLTLAMDQRKELIATVLQELLQPRCILERNDAPIRKAEGLDSVTGVLFGEEPAPMVLESGGLKFQVDLSSGQKTGLYVDQLDAYHAVAAHAKGRRVLDCFSNQGGFALACAKAGAAEVTAVEISRDAVSSILRNAELNEVKVKAIDANVFDFLKLAEQRNEKWDLIVLDPPSFTKTKGKLNDALRGYKEIHLRALKLLNPDGLIATYCCSHHVTREIFQQVIVEACVDAKRSVRQLAVYSQRADHPVVPLLPETEYLKGFLLEAMPGR